MPHYNRRFSGGNRTARRTGKLIFFSLTFILCLVFCFGGTVAESTWAGMTADDIIGLLTLEQKVSQMVQPACYNIKDQEMKVYCYGSVLSQGPHLDAYGWRDYITGLQQAALASEAGVPFIYGQDYSTILLY